MNLLITGGCGFIGSHFVEYFLKKYPQDHVTNVDSMTYAAHPDTARHVASIAPDRYHFVHEDIASPRLLDVMKERKIDAVVNFAACDLAPSCMNSFFFLTRSGTTTERHLRMYCSAFKRNCLHSPSSVSFFAGKMINGDLYP